MVINYYTYFVQHGDIPSLHLQNDRNTIGNDQSRETTKPRAKTPIRARPTPLVDNEIRQNRKRENENTHPIYRAQSRRLRSCTRRSRPASS